VSRAPAWLRGFAFLTAAAVTFAIAAFSVALWLDRPADVTAMRSLNFGQSNCD